MLPLSLSEQFQTALQLLSWQVGISASNHIIVKYGLLGQHVMYMATTSLGTSFTYLELATVVW